MGTTPENVHLVDLAGCFWSITASTILLSMGIHPKVVQELLGHSNISMTMNTYSHVLPAMQQEAMEKMNKLFGGQFLGQHAVRYAVRPCLAVFAHGFSCLEMLAEGDLVCKARVLGHYITMPGYRQCFIEVGSRQLEESSLTNV